MTSEPAPVRRGLSPGMRAFLLVDVVLVLVFVAILLATRTGAGDSTGSPTASENPGAPAQSATPGPTRTPWSTEPTGEAELFASPSGNIVCSIAPEGASCSIAELAKEGLVKDEDCQGTVGHIVRVGTDGAERPCVAGEPPGKAPEATPELDYEDARSAFGYTCTSSRSGMICRHDESGHGFSIARAGSSLF